MSIVQSEYWGICMNSKGNAEAFTNALVASSIMHPEGIRYLEVGLGGCGTINAVDWTLSQLPGNHKMVGVEHVSWGEGFMMPYLASLFIRDAHQIPQGEWDVVFIDACHCKQCVINDFNSVKDVITSRGFLIFHDTSPEFQGLHANMSEHQKNGIEVLAALEECDLSGFELLADVPGIPPGVSGIRVYQRKD